MSAQLQDALRALYREQFEQVGAIDAEGQVALDEARANAMDAYIFPDATGSLLDPDNFRHRLFKPLLKAAGLRHIRIHDLRHTYVSLLIAAGKELHYIQQQLGHHSPAFTLSVYGHLLPRDRRGEVNCLDDAAPTGTPVAPNAKNDVLDKKGKALDSAESQGFSRLPGEDLNLRPSGYERDWRHRLH